MHRAAYEDNGKWPQESGGRGGPPPSMSPPRPPKFASGRADRQGRQYTRYHEEHAGARGSGYVSRTTVPGHADRLRRASITWLEESVTFFLPWDPGFISRLVKGCGSLAHAKSLTAH